MKMTEGVGYQAYERERGVPGNIIFGDSIFVDSVGVWVEYTVDLGPENRLRIRGSTS